jgi:hypothetical protein
MPRFECLSQTNDRKARLQPATDKDSYPDCEPCSLNLEPETIQCRPSTPRAKRLRPTSHLGPHRPPAWPDRPDGPHEHATEVAKTLRRTTFGESRGGIPILAGVVPATVVYREAATSRWQLPRSRRHQAVYCRHQCCSG